LLLAVVISLTIANANVQSTQYTYLLIPLLSLPISSAQWLVLRHYQPGTWFWIITTPLALLLWSSFLRFRPASQWSFVDDESIFVIAVLYSILALLIGICQWVILRRHFNRAWIWIVGNILSLGVGVALFMALGAGFASAMVWILIYIGGTGICLLYLQNQQLKERWVRADSI
jgi:hypothetical protein